MKKILYVIEREFITGIRKKSFIAATFIAPFIFMTPFIIMMFWQANNKQPNKVGIIDEAGLFEGQTLKDTDDVVFLFEKGDIEKAKNNLASKKDYIGLLYVPKNINVADSENSGIQYIVDKKKTKYSTFGYVEKTVAQSLRHFKLMNEGLSTASIANLNSNLKLQQFVINKEEEGLRRIASTLAYIVGMIMYLMLIIYTNALLRGVIEEKTEHIAEVISMVIKPFHLMLGKIMGIGLVGLVQLLLWIGLSVVIAKGVQLTSELYFGIDLVEMNKANQRNSTSIQELFSNYQALPLLKIAIVTPIFFVFGFLLNGAVTAAIGATSSETGDSSLAFVGNFMNIIGIYVAMFAVGNPESGLAQAALYIPFLSPIVVPALLPFDLPISTILISLAILLASFICLTYYAGKIYRISILSYGNKITLKDIVYILRNE